mmetsp:Transcript_53346/g.103184  ORF Transcript_53346/g.103184 Transcript_53346/m.103184 type:complete len:273 (-) Transcript_53346:1352-2170(-)
MQAILNCCPAPLVPEHVPHHRACLMNTQAAEQCRVGHCLSYPFLLFCPTVPFAALQLAGWLSAFQVLDLRRHAAQHRRHQHSRNLAKPLDQASRSAAAAAAAAAVAAAAAAAVAHSPSEAAQEALKFLTQSRWKESVHGLRVSRSAAAPALDANGVFPPPASSLAIAAPVCRHGDSDLLHHSGSSAHTYPCHSTSSLPQTLHMPRTRYWISPMVPACDANFQTQFGWRFPHQLVGLSAAWNNGATHPLALAPQIAHFPPVAHADPLIVRCMQ